MGEGLRRLWLGALLIVGVSVGLLLFDRGGRRGGTRGAPQAGEHAGVHQRGG